MVLLKGDLREKGGDENFERMNGKNIYCQKFGRGRKKQLFEIGRRGKGPLFVRKI
jgi:hypothetical protein